MERVLCRKLEIERMCRVRREWSDDVAEHGTSESVGRFRRQDVIAAVNADVRGNRCEYVFWIYVCSVEVIQMMNYVGVIEAEAGQTIGQVRL